MAAAARSRSCTSDGILCKRVLSSPEYFGPHLPLQFARKGKCLPLARLAVPHSWPGQLTLRPWLFNQHPEKHPMVAPPPLKMVLVWLAHSVSNPSSVVHLGERCVRQFSFLPWQAVIPVYQCYFKQRTYKIRVQFSNMSNLETQCVAESRCFFTDLKNHFTHPVLAEFSQKIK